MKVIVAGSRDITDLEVVSAVIYDAPFFSQIEEIVSGCARGVDSLGEEFAQKHGIPVKRFPAQWAKFGKQSGFFRNSEMAIYADALIAIWDGKSRGTKHMIDLAKAIPLEVYVRIIHA